MDLPRPALLKQLQLVLSVEGRGFAYYVSDLGSGKILSVPRKTAAAMIRFADAARGDTRAREQMTEDDARDSYGVLSYLRTARDHDRLKGRKFNPLSVQVDLFDVGPHQHRLERLAQWFIGWRALTLIGVLLAVSLFLGTRNGWAIQSEFDGVLSLSALAAFGLVAPFLKIIHEFGHVLVATRFGVGVRMAGINFIGLYPLPFVDCSEADVSARRRHRVLISLAGIFTDLLVGLFAFLLWHMVEGEFLRTMAGRILVFSTLNSVMFNANPLMKLDGYYAVVDLIGQRNLSTRAMQGFAQLRKYVFTLAAQGGLPKGRAAWATTLYGAASTAYRLFILYIIVTSVMPKYLGLGMVLAVWGGYLMFLSPILADTRPVVPGPPVSPARLWSRRGLAFGLIGLVFLVVPAPFVLNLPLSLDLENRYVLTIGKGGVLTAPPLAAGQVAAGAQLALLENPGLADERAMSVLALAEAQLLQDSVQGVDAAQAQLARDKLAAVQTRAAVLRTEIDSLTLFAPAQGLFLPDAALRRGKFLRDGARIGRFLPADGRAVLIGAFPERWVEKYQGELIAAELRDQQKYATIALDRLRLVEISSIDRGTGTRSFALEVVHDDPAASLAGHDVQIRLDFGMQPLWRHVEFWVQARLAAFRDAQLADRLSGMGGAS